MKKTEADTIQIKNHTHQKNQTNQGSDNMKQGKNSLNHDSLDSLDSYDSKNKANHEKYKNQGSDKMKNWEKKKLGDICGFVRGPFGGSLKKNIFRPEGYAVYEQQHAIYDQFDDIRYFIDENKFNEMKRFELKAGDLIMSCSGTMGKVAIVPNEFKEGIINQALLKISPSNKISNVFLKLWMQSESFQESLKNYSGGAAIQNVASVAILKGIEIPLPPLPEQQRIVSILDECFAAIDKAKANAEQNLKNAKELFESYLQGVFEKKGEGWVKTSLKNEIELLSGFAFMSKYYSEINDDILLVRGENIMQGYFRWEDVKRWNRDEFEEYKRFQLFENDVVLAMDRPWVKAGLKCAKISKNELPSLLVQRTASLRCKKNMDAGFLFYLVKSSAFTNHLLGVQTGIGVPHISGKQILDFNFNRPSLKDQQTIIRQLDALRAETQKLEAVYQKKIADLEELKKSILQKAFAGELMSEPLINAD